MSYKITRLGHQGDGIADGPVYAARTLPSEFVDGDLVSGRLENIRILEPSDQRVKPPCKHYKSCGGCALQHASDQFVKNWKQEIVLGALRGQGVESNIRSYKTSPSNSRIRITFSGRKTKKGTLVGLHAKGSDTIIQIPDCKLIHPELVASIPVVKEITELGASRKSEIRISVTHSIAGLDIAVFDAKQSDDKFFITLAALAEKYSLARLTWNDELIVEREKPLQMFGTASVNPPAGSFLQATEHGKKTLTDSVVSAVLDAKHVIDLFSGCGTFSLPMAQQSTIHAVETNSEMLKALDLGWRNTAHLKKVTTEARDLFRRPLLADEMKKPDAIVIDPPRAGASQQMEQVSLSKVRKVVYVSCNPITFAKDTKMLIDAGYSIDSIDIVDQFRWSTHIEIVAVFTL